jgi:hypothetical protein
VSAKKAFTSVVAKTKKEDLIQLSKPHFGGHYLSLLTKHFPPQLLKNTILAAEITNTSPLTKTPE